MLSFHFQSVYIEGNHIAAIQNSSTEKEKKNSSTHSHTVILYSSVYDIVMVLLQATSYILINDDLIYTCVPVAIRNYIDPSGIITGSFKNFMVVNLVCSCARPMILASSLKGPVFVNWVLFGLTFFFFFDGLDLPFVAQ